MTHQEFLIGPHTDLLARLGRFFATRGCNAFLVGGYLRDSLLLVPPEHDLDIALSVDPQPVGRELARWLGGTFVPLSPAHGVARVVVPGTGDPTLQQSRGGPLGEAQADVWSVDLTAFPGTIEEDLARRDFTVNALALPLEHWAYPVTGEGVIDPYNGRQDLARKRIRAVGPHVFSHDPGRLLRAVRLAARLRFRLDPATARLALAEAARVSEVPGERVRDEFLGILSLDGARGYLEVLDRLDLLCRIIPELAPTKGVEQPKEHYWDVWGHLMHSVEGAELVTKGHQNSPVYSFVPWSAESEGYFSQQISDGHSRRTVLKLAALFHDIAKPQTKKQDATGRIRFLGHSQVGASIAQARLAHLRLSSRGTAAVARMVAEHLRPATMWQGVELPTARAIHRYFRDLGGAAIDTLYLCLADYLAAKGPELVLGNWASHARMVGHILELGAHPPASAQRQRLVTGHDLMEYFHLEPGPVIGKLLEQVDEAQAAGEVATREEAMRLASEALTNIIQVTGG